MAGPEDLKKLSVGYPGGVVLHQHRLGVISQIFIDGILRRASPIPGPSPYNTLHQPEPGVCAPESAEAKGCGLQLRGDLPVNGRPLSRPGFPGEHNHGR